MSDATWRGRTLGAALALLVQALFLSMVVLSPSRPMKPPISLAHETIFLLRPLTRPAPTTIDARSIASPRLHKIAPVTVPTLPPAAAPSLAPPSGLAGFGRALSFWTHAQEEPAGAMPLALMRGSACGPDKKPISARAAATSLAAAPTPAA